MDAQNLHRRKASRDEDENMVLDTRPMDYDEPLDIPLMLAPPPPRNRVQSTPNHHGHSRSVSAAGVPASGGPFRQNFALGRPPSGSSYPSSASPFRSSFLPPISTGSLSGGHSRTRSVSAFSPTVSSPLASSFPPKTPTLYPFPPPMDVTQSAPDLPPASKAQRHRRLHSRNLSVFFPRPGSMPQTSISEDGGQDIEVPVDIEAPVSDVPPAQPAIDFPTTRNGGPPTPLKAGFTFGGRPSSGGLPTPEPMSARSTTTSTSRRGHHHKHSMSHNFFSFLEPGANMRPKTEELTTQPTPMPVSPWAPMSAFPQSANPTTESFQQPEITNGNGHFPEEGEKISQSPPGALAVGFLQFIMGAWLWVCGQQIGSLSVTGLGYWVVFDAFGVVLSAYIPQWLGLYRMPSTHGGKIRRSYGNTPVETVLMFAHAVYLMFSSVYVCKETVEHLLLTAGGEEGHHHHHGDEDESIVAITFPILMTTLTLLSLSLTSLVYNNHSRLVNITGNRLPRFSTILRSLVSPTTMPDPPPTAPLDRMFTNPFSASPFIFCVAILFIALMAPETQHRTCDLLLAAIITIATFKVAYRACVILGTVLLQTSPARGSASGRMEAFLRAMREVERHPQVLHLPAPHIWQLSPSPSLYLPGSNVKQSVEATESLVVTMELHVKHDLGDDDVLKLTRWAWEKCSGALGDTRSHLRCGISAEVTVGVVRG